MQIQIINKSVHSIPEYATTGSSGVDLKANINSPILIGAFERILVSTGIFIAIPEGVEAQVRPRSGMALKQGITCLNTPGTIDADYRGEIKVLLINLSNEYQRIENGDRIAQLVFCPIIKITWEQVNNFETTTQRGDGAFGHTGKN